MNRHRNRLKPSLELDDLSKLSQVASGSSVKKLHKRRTAPADIRRRQLIDATLEVIAEHGVSGTTMALVTGKAELSIGLVNLHFKSKENLLKSTLRFLADELRATWLSIQTDQSLTNSEKLSKMTAANFHPKVCTPTKIAVWFGFFGEAHYRRFYCETVQALDKERVYAVEALCAALKEEGAYTELDPVSTALSIESMVDGLWLNYLLYPDWVSVERAKKQIHALLCKSFPRHYADVPIPVDTQPHSKWGSDKQ